jgi:hypothetical protein
VKKSAKQFDEMTESAKQTISEAAARATDGKDDPELVKKQVKEKADQASTVAHNKKEEGKAKVHNAAESAKQKTSAKK